MEEQHLFKRHARVDVADVLRGLSVMAIIFLHAIEHFNFYSFPDTSTQSSWLTFTDRAVWDGLFFLFAGKAYAIFAFLFGFSFFIQEDNQRMKGRDFRLRFCWRLVLLFLIGNLNACFFTAEVLVLFSIVGFVLVLTCRLSNRSAFLLACILMLQPVSLYHVLRVLLDSSYQVPALPTASLWDATFAVQTSGTFLETVKVNLWEGQLASLAWAWDNARFFQTASLFILGMLVGRKEWLLEKNLHHWGYIGVGALFLFFPLYGLNNMLPDFISNKNLLTPLSLVLSSLHKVAFMFVLVSTILFLYYRTAAHRWLNKIIPYGKMSLTNYITQSIIGSAVFYHWGLGMHAHWGITFSFLFGVFIFLVQCVFCSWWMRFHKHGPLEFLWKKATWILNR